MMNGFINTFIKAGLGLTSAALLVLGLQTQAAAAENPKSGAILLAQNVEPKEAPKKEPPKATKPSSPTEPGKVRKYEYKPPPAARPMMRGRPAPQPEAVQEAPAASGTKRLGGGTIRDRKGPEDE